MKRYLSLVLIMAVLMSCVILPVFADENSTGNWIELLDYGTVNASGTNVFGITGSKTISLAFPTGSKSVGHVNVLLYSSQVISDAYVKDSDGTVHSFNVYPIGQGLYRVFGDLNHYIYTSLNLTLETNSSNTAYCELLSCRITTVIFNRKQVPAHATGTIYKTTPLYPSLSYPSYDSFSNWFSWVYDNMDDYEYQGWNGSFQFNLYLDDWEEYDFVDIEITGQWENLTSIYAELDNLAIPYESSTVYSVDGVRSGVYITLDLRNVDRRYTGHPIVYIYGSGYYNPSLPDMNPNSFRIEGVYGYIQENDPEPLGYWMRFLRDHLSSLFNNLSSSFGSSISSLGSNIESWISSQTSSIQTAMGVMRQNLVNGIGGFITDFSTNVNNWISSQTQSINLAIGTMKNGILQALKDLGDDLGVTFASQANRIIASITDGVDRIVESITGTGSADDFSDKVSQQGSALESMAGQMGAISRPDVNNAVPDIGGMLNVSGAVNLASVFSPFWENSYFLRLLLGSLSVSLAFVVIYGGKK